MFSNFILKATDYGFFSREITLSNIYITYWDLNSAYQPDQLII